MARRFAAYHGLDYGTALLKRQEQRRRQVEPEIPRARAEIYPSGKLLDG